MGKNADKESRRKGAGRTTVYNNITSKEKLERVNPDNIELENDFLDYLASLEKAAGTIKQYRANLHVFWCWNLEHNKNKFFVDLTKREISKFQSHAVNEWQWSPKRIRTVKATISSLSNYIENILDDEYEGYKPIVRKIESPANVAVREKTVFKKEDLQRILDKLVEDKDYYRACVLSFAMNSGRRKAEIARMKVNYFDKSNILFEGALYKTPEKVMTKGKGNRGKMLDIYTLAKPFQPYLDLWLEQRKELGIKSEWLFPKYEGKVWFDKQIEITTLDSWARIFSDICGKPFYWHSLRHYFTTELIGSGIPDSVVQEIIGWSSADMVKIYDDTPKEEMFGKYFGADGIVQNKPTNLTEL